MVGDSNAWTTCTTMDSSNGGFMPEGWEEDTGEEVEDYDGD